MGEFARYHSRHEVDERHRAARPAARGDAASRFAQGIPPQIQPRTKNVEAILSLGSVRYFTFRGTVYGVPPVPFKVGEQILDLHVQVLTLARTIVTTKTSQISAESSKEYFKALSRLSSVLWKNMRPIGKVRKFIWRIGGMRNPLRGATEMEVKDITDFFLQGRTKSSVQFSTESIPAIDKLMF